MKLKPGGWKSDPGIRESLALSNSELEAKGY